MAEIANAELLYNAEKDLALAAENNNQMGVLAALRSIAASQLVMARADVHRSTP